MTLAILAILGGLCAALAYALSVRFVPALMDRLLDLTLRFRESESGERDLSGPDMWCDLAHRHHWEAKEDGKWWGRHGRRYLCWKCKREWVFFPEN
jgi:hypothetical protein